MIERFTRLPDTGYYNIIELAWLYIVSEIVDYLIIFGAYNPVAQEYNKRRILWVVVLTISFIVMFTLVSLTCMAYLFNFIAGYYNG